MKILVLGAGWMGRAVVFDLLRNPRINSVILADASAQQLKETETFLKLRNELRFSTKKINVEMLFCVFLSSFFWFFVFCCVAEFFSNVA